MKLKKGDNILVIKGRDRGKSGKVVFVDPKDEKIVVEGVNIYKAHVKPSSKYPQGGIIDKNMPIRQQNASIICPSCNKATKIKSSGTGKEKQRVCAKCKESLDAIK